MLKYYKIIALHKLTMLGNNSIQVCVYINVQVIVFIPTLLIISIFSYKILLANIQWLLCRIIVYIVLLFWGNNLACNSLDRDIS